MSKILDIATRIFDEYMKKWQSVVFKVGLARLPNCRYGIYRSSVSLSTVLLVRAIQIARSITCQLVVRSVVDACTDVLGNEH